MEVSSIKVPSRSCLVVGDFGHSELKKLLKLSLYIYVYVVPTTIIYYFIMHNNDLKK